MMQLPPGYEIREMTEQEFSPLWKEHAQRIFDDNSQIFRVREFLSDQEKSKLKELWGNMGTPYELRLGLFHNGEFAGWCAGHQESAEIYYMRNSAVLPEHRRKGLYTAMLKHSISALEAKGFQKIYSRHSATNNEIIIPKLKLGFTISGFEVTDMFGVLVQLVYFPKELRRKVMLYRVGDLKPDDEIRNCLKI
jgi:ribosomal protein S18 acetylase RimI-like enzyme